MNRSVRRLVWVTLGLVVCVLAAGRLALEYGDQLLREYLLEQLAHHYAPLNVSIRSVERVPNEGIEIRGLVISEGSTQSQQRLLFVDELFIRCNTSWKLLLKKQIGIRQIVIRRPKVHAQQRSDGSWNIEALAKLPQLGGVPLKTLPPLQIEGAEIEILHSASAEPMILQHFHGTCRQLSGARGKSATLKFDGNCASPLFDSATIAGEASWPVRDWSIAGEIKNLRISPQLPACLPGPLAKRLTPLAALRGWSHLSYSVASTPGKPLNYSVRGQLFDGSLSEESLPYQVTRLGADFRFDNSGISIDHATARAGNAQLRLHLIRSEDDPSQPLVLKAETDAFPLDSSLPQILPDHLRELWDEFSPSGVADMSMELKLDGRSMQPNATITCRDLSFTYSKFPYRVHDASGTLKLVDGLVHVDLQTPINGKTTFLTGEINVFEKPISGWLDIKTDGAIPLDEALLSAIAEKPQRIIRSLHPTGMIEVRGRFERLPGEYEVHRRLDVQLQNCSLRYDGFPYPLDGINGLLRIADDSWSFQNMTGRNGSASIAASGSFNPLATDHQLDLHFECNDVALDDSLNNAFRDDVRRIWAKLQPRGTLDFLDIHVRYKRGDPLDVEVFAQKWDPHQSMEGRTVTLKPVWFPYRLDNVIGSFHYRNGVVTIQQLEAEHGNTRLKQFAGVCQQYPSGGWQLNVTELDADQLQLDKEFLGALPKKLARALARLQLSGSISMNGWMKFRGTGQDGVDTAQWDLATDMEDATLDCGVRLDHLRGGIRWTGDYENEQPIVRGELRMDSLVFRGIHVTHVRGPLRIDEREMTLGADSQSEPTESGLPRRIAAKVFDGEVELDARLSLAEDARFALQANLADADLARVAMETGTATAAITGKTFAAVQLSGQLARRESWRGAGTAKLFDADIYQLPLMVALLKLLNVKSPDATAFTNADAEYDITGDHVYFKRIGLQGDAVSLIGKGDMNMQRQLDLDFYAVVGREEWQLPLFRPLFKEAARNVLSIKVSGTVNAPTVDPQPFPELNNTLQFLFPETTRGEPVPDLLPR